ncbi:hypothetical protein [Sphingomicrobium nitratireducens]|uniref:hypothetical protein n=1 Tax=Sphingomicrobium nitratireducens TaxID=2964666 RepID=UPI00223EDD61|nr:hypothetical protein [Sphingomicrobium nitratireducens]
MSNFRFLLVTAPFALTAACATTETQTASTGPNLETVFVETVPAGVTATSYWGDRCVTPCNLRLSSSKGGVITLEKQGYAVEQRFVTSGLGHYSRPPRMFGSYGPLVVEPQPDPGDAMIQYRYWLGQPEGPFSSLDVHRVLVEMTPA